MSWNAAIENEAARQVFEISKELRQLKRTQDDRTAEKLELLGELEDITLHTQSPTVLAQCRRLLDEFAYVRERARPQRFGAL